MPFEEFNKWCNERACDGCWSMDTAILCIAINRQMYKQPFWKRKKVWEQEYQEIAEQIVEEINAKIDEIMIDDWRKKMSMELVAIDFETNEEERAYLEGLVYWLEDRIADPNCLDDKRKLRGWLSRTKKELKKWRGEER